MAITSSQAGINLTISKLQLIELNWNGDEAVLENADEEFLSGYIDRNTSEPELISTIQEAFNRIAIRKPLSSKTVSFTLPTQLFEIVELPIDDLLTKEDLANHLNWEFSVLFPQKDPSDFLLRYFETGGGEIMNTKTILVAAIEKKILGAIHKFCMLNKLALRLVDNVHFAANLLIRPESPLQNYISVYSDDNYYSLMIFEKGKPKLFKSFDEQDLNKAAQKIRMEYLNFYSTRVDLSAMKNIYIAGESFTDNTVLAFENVLKIPVLKLNPFEKLKSAPGMQKTDLIRDKYYSFAAPAGIAARIS